MTGAGRGIGRAIALALAGAGADVAVNDFADEEACQAVVAEVEALGRKGLVVMGDVSDEEQVDAMVERAEKELGPLSVVVNNAGITRDNVVMMMDPADFDSVVAHAPARHVPREQGGGAQDVPPPQRLYHQPFERRRPPGQRGPGQLRGGQGGDHRPHQVAGQGARRARRARQRHRSRLHRHADDTGAS